MMGSFKTIVLFVVIFALSELGQADTVPAANKCYAYKQGAFATQGGSTEPRQEKSCGQNSFCYVARKEVREGQGLSATRWQFEGDCIQKDDPILNHPGIDDNEIPSCSNEVKNNKDYVCVCNKNLCNEEVSS